MTTHVFIVDVNTFKYHLEYGFVGTGNKDYYVDFNNNYNTSLHPTSENSILCLIADFSRVQIGDLVIFYLQQNCENGIYEGKFYGFFKISSLVFLDNNDDKQFLKDELKKSLTFRCFIEPCGVYAEGVTEWEALDEIKDIISPNQMLWSLIYRKLKGNRGNTMITMYESDRLINLIRKKNNFVNLSYNRYSFDVYLQKIINTNFSLNYSDRMEKINILPRLFQKYYDGKQFEMHLQVYILQEFYKTHFFGLLSNEHIEWLGNEVGCGVGMQSIDIMASSSININGLIYKKVIPVELKSCEVYPEIILQMQRYINWLNQYYVPNHQSSILPVIICRKTNKNSTNYKIFYEEV
ncbi:DUF91 domain-containing protein, partial [Campylobacter jejuni]|nr:DUF91 domain-containing protein [Campylobacter jejuni]EAJ5642875.1 DUF91 domain-containing protein [Campylobacter jejuni]